MAGLLGRWRLMLEDPEEPEPGHSVEALNVAYQQRLGWLHEIRAEAERLAAERRRLAIGLGSSPDPDSAAWVAARDAELAAAERVVAELGAAARAQVDRFRVEREAILATPDRQLAARRAREALRRWHTESGALLQEAADRFEEPSGYVTDTGQPETFEQPPGGPR